MYDRLQVCIYTRKTGELAVGHYVQNHPGSYEIKTNAAVHRPQLRANFHTLQTSAGVLMFSANGTVAIVVPPLYGEHGNDIPT